jgi:two-component system, cell cycle sensor histidine kinase and response regulator CckA
MKILVVDDIEDSRVLLKTNLEYNGFMVTEAFDGQQALEMVRKSRPDLIISDVLMPVMDGFQLCRNMKQDDQLKNIPFVFYSATYTDQRDEELALKVGADRFIRKPAEPEEFVRILREVIETAEKGEIELKVRQVKDDREIFKLYDERLVKKLEKKMLELKKEIEEHNKAERDLKEIQERFRLSFDNANIGMCLVDLEGRLMRVNPKMCKILGYTQKELENMTINDITHPEDLNISPTFIRQAVSGEVFHAELENRYFHKQGHIVWAKVSCSIVRDSQGTPLYFISHVQDISEQKIAEQSMRESEKRYRAVFENTGTAMIIVDEDMTLSMVNSEFEMLSGYSKDQLEGKTRWTEFVAPEDLDRMQRYHTERRENGNKNPREYEFRFRDRLGIIKHMLVNVGMIQGTKMSVASLTDITRRIKTEEALQESEKKYRLLVNNLSSIVYRGFKDFSVEFFDNKIESLTGYSKDEFNSKRMKWSDVIVEEDRKTAREEIARALKTTGRSYVREYRIKTKPENILWIQERGHIICNENGDIDYISGVFFDITQTKRLESELRQAQKMEAIGTLASGVAHDFNNFLSVIFGNADLLLMDLNKDHPFYAGIWEIRKAGAGAASLTRQLLTFSRKQAIHLEIMNLNDVIQTITKMLALLIGENIELQTFLDPDLKLVEVDFGQMEQVLINLSVNARDAMPTGGKLTVETKNLDLDEFFFKIHGVEGDPGSYVMLRVCDTGIGMEEEILFHIFDPFFTTKGIERGTGLGLSTVYGIVKQNNGYIFVDSKPGKGSAFDIYLPAVRKEKKPAGSEMVAKDSLAGSETILVVEDEMTLRKLTSRILGRYGYRVLQASNGDEALTVSHNHDGPIHLVLTDVIMPGISVQEMAKKIQFRRKESRILFTSGYMDDTISQQGVLKSGINLLQKPYTPEGLARKVREMLDRDSGG